MICIAQNSGGKGGVSGGAGAEGQPSQKAGGFGASGYGYPVIETVTGVTADFSVQLTKDTDGTIPSDLSNIASVELVARPSMRCQGRAEIHADCEFTPDGVVAFTLGPEQVDCNNGVWYAEFLCRDSEGVLRQDYRAYLCIRKGTQGSKDGPHTVTPMDVRMALMDTSAEANQLLDDLEFSDQMILNAVERCMDEWNETPPELLKRYDATTFPWREHLIKGAVGYLMQSVAYRYTRNRMQYSASGLSLDTNDKGPVYVQLAAAARQEWKNFVAAKKTECNMAECFGTVSLPYFDSREW